MIVPAAPRDYPPTPPPRAATAAAPGSRAAVVPPSYIFIYSYIHIFIYTQNIRFSALIYIFMYYRVAKIHRTPDLNRSFSTKEPDN